MFDSACNSCNMREKFNKRTEENTLLVLQNFSFQEYAIWLIL